MLITAPWGHDKNGFQLEAALSHLLQHAHSGSRALMTSRITPVNKWVRVVAMVHLEGNQNCQYFKSH